MMIGAVSRLQENVNVFPSHLRGLRIGSCFPKTKEQELLLYHHAFIIAAGSGTVAAVAALIAGLPAIAALIGTISLCSGAGAWAAYLGSQSTPNQPPIIITTSVPNISRRRLNKHVERIQSLQTEITQEKEHVLSLQAKRRALKSKLSKKTKKLEDLREIHRSLEDQLQKAATEVKLNQAEPILPERVSLPTRKEPEFDCETYAEVMQDDYQDILHNLDQLAQQKHQVFSIADVLSNKGKKKQKEHFIDQVNALRGFFDSSLHQLKNTAQRINQHTIVSAELKILAQVRKTIEHEKRRLAELESQKGQVHADISQAFLQLQEAKLWLQQHIEVMKREREACSFDFHQTFKADPPPLYARDCT